MLAKLSNRGQLGKLGRKNRQIRQISFVTSTDFVLIFKWSYKRPKICPFLSDCAKLGTDYGTFGQNLSNSECHLNFQKTLMTVEVFHIQSVIKEVGLSITNISDNFFPCMEQVDSTNY